MSSVNRDYILAFDSEMALAGILRPLVLVTKGCMYRSLAEALEELQLKIIIFHSQSFQRATLAIRTETGPVLTPGQTSDAAATYRGLTNITPAHFWRPITGKCVPSEAWATEVVQQLKVAEYRCSIAIGLSVGDGISQEDLIETGLLEQPSEVRGEIWDERVWSDIVSAATTIGYPAYRSTSCAIALASGDPEVYGTSDGVQQRNACRATARQLRETSAAPRSSNRLIWRSR